MDIGKLDEQPRNDFQQVADQLKALAHPVRLQILRQLQKSDSCRCRDFCEYLPLAQSTISQHLKILINGGIINYAPSGNSSRYTINYQALDAINQAIINIRNLGQSASSTCLTKNSSNDGTILNVSRSPRD